VTAVDKSSYHTIFWPNQIILIVTAVVYSIIYFPLLGVGPAVGTQTSQDQNHGHHGNFALRWEAVMS